MDKLLKNIQNAALIEAVYEKEGDPIGAAWLIRVIQSGLSGNNNFYSDASLKAAVPLFEGVRVFVKSDHVHLQGGGKDVRNLVGGLSQARFVEGATPNTGEIQARLDVINPNSETSVQMREAFTRKMAHLFGFSVDMRGTTKKQKSGHKTIQHLVEAKIVNSVDLIVEAGAGGKIINLLEAVDDTADENIPPEHITPKQGDTAVNSKKLISMIEATRPDLLKDKDASKMDAAELEALFKEALENPAEAEDAKATDKEGGDFKEAKADDKGSDLEEAVRMVEARFYMAQNIDASELPAKAKTKLKKQFKGLANFTEAQVDEAIKDERDYLAEFTESGRVQDCGAVSRIEMGETRQEKVSQMFEAFFDKGHKEHKHALSIKNCYIEATGDRLVTGRLKESNLAIMRESLGTADLANALGDAMNKKMVKAYNLRSVEDNWREIVTIEPVFDFKTQERVRIGGYGDIPTVAEKAAYTELASPTDEVSKYGVVKRGGTESISMEAIKNDDVGAIRNIPLRMTAAARRTLSKFVFNFFKDNPLIYDATNLFTVGHGNLGSAALSAASYAARRLAMLNQVETGSGEKLSIAPAFLLVPDALEQVAYDLFVRDTNNDQNFVQSVKPKILPVWDWTDVNDWCLAADPHATAGLEIGFLDGNEDPQLFVQDNPSNGSMFTNDMLTYKLQHIYNGAVSDFRAFDKSVVL